MGLATRCERQVLTPDLSAQADGEATGVEHKIRITLTTSKSVVAISSDSIKIIRSHHF